MFLLQTLLLRTLGSGLERKPMEHSFLLPVLSSGQGGSDPSHLQGLSESHSCARCWQPSTQAHIPPSTWSI